MASLATVGALAVPLAVAAPASAATPATVTVSPSAAYTAPSGSTDFTVGVADNSAATAADDVYYDIYSGPDATTSTPLTGTSCTAGAGVATGASTTTCSVTVGTTPGVDSIHFFLAPKGSTQNFTTSDPHADATLTVVGALNKVTITPTAQHSAQGVYSEYTVKATDAQGNPIPGEKVTVTATQSNAADADLDVTGTNPTNNVTGTDTASAAGTNGSATATVTTAATGSTAGTAPVWIASEVTGTVDITAGTSPITATAVQTVDPGTANDVTSIVLSPSSQNAYEGSTVTFTATVTNKEGDTVGGITPSASVISGPSKGATVTATTTDGTGTSTLTYTAASTAGTDTLQAWVNQTSHTVNSGGLDTGEPNDTATATLAPYNLSGGSITGKDATVPAGTQTAPVTFTLKDSNGTAVSGVTLTFTLPNGNAVDGQYSVSPTTAVTDANGQATTTVTDTSAAAGDKVVVTATGPTPPGAGTALSGTATVSWKAANTLTTVSISPSSATSTAGGTSATYTAKVTDAFGNPVTSGVTYSWIVSGRNNAANNVGATQTGTSATFSYTDKGSATSPGKDTVTVTATQGGASSPATATQYWVVSGAGTAQQANIDLTGNGVQSGADYETTGGVTCAPSATTQTCTPSNFTSTDDVAAGDVEQVNVGLVDAYGDQLEGKQVNLSISGTGQFVDANGNAIGSSTTATVEDGTGTNWAMAVAYVSAKGTGTGTIIATVDGLSAKATVTFTGEYAGITPERVVDTRIGQGAVTSSAGPPVDGELAPGTPYYFSLSNTNLPTGEDAYAFNVTAINPAHAGNLRIGPWCFGTGIPSTSLINYQPNKVVANFVVVPNSGCDEFVIYSAGSRVAVAIDAVGYYGSGVNPVTPYRVIDTRNVGGTIAAGSSRSFQITGTNGSSGVPFGATAVALNVTAINPSGTGNLRIYPDGSAKPNSSSTNYIPGVSKAAFVIVKLPANGKIDVYSAGSSVNVAIDAFAYFTGSGSSNPTTMVTQAPVRILDTRTSPSLTLHDGTPVSIPVAGAATGNVPADAQAVLVTVTGIQNSSSTGFGNLRVYPAGDATPTVSTLNYVGKYAVANFDIVPIGKDGKITLLTSGSNVDATVDVVGWIPAAS